MDETCSSDERIDAIRPNFCYAASLQKVTWKAHSRRQDYLKIFLTETRCEDWEWARLAWYYGCSNSDSTTGVLLQNVSLCHMALLPCRDRHATVYHLTARYTKDKELKV